MRLQHLALFFLPLVIAKFNPVDDSDQRRPLRNQQIPMVFDEPEYTPEVKSQPSLADLLTIEPSASIFYSYARELEISRLFEDESAKLTLLVPTNKAVMALARKPHQDPVLTDDTAISEEEFDKLSKQNVERWVSAHIIPESLSSLEHRSYSTLLDGKSVSFSASGKDAEPSWQDTVAEDGIRIKEMKEASNGVIYILDGTISIETS
ncbi:hypothetical protein VNI00_000601 [Paramarasmius palmivorus]|uniref:FAS1 domain-containing protein n=1 Tax=Paramarasmius palmivorus TaxID=297713 RepID=A0AAW0EBL2_9AGAR